MSKKKQTKTIQELETPKVRMTPDSSAVETNPDKQYDEERVYVQARSRMPENQLFDFAVYEPQAEAVDTEDTSHTEEPQG